MKEKSRKSVDETKTTIIKRKYSSYLKIIIIIIIITRKIRKKPHFFNGADLFLMSFCRNENGNC
jgi:hypothetical protein